MKKNAPKKKATGYKPAPAVNKTEEPNASYYRSIKVSAAVKDFTYSEFKKIADKVPFTQAEWATILHVSERTLQRYAKANSVFAPINAERAMQIAQVLTRAKEVFGDTAKFYHWIKRSPYALEGNLSMQSLTTNDGINKVLTQLGRIEHGLFA
ncbi:type II RES/Xre toxin-antitoxin system antitoxin [Ferruginibacter sp. SUN106]|uniref:type II RES/Xre toxin-antitoxin system antitoxin n=1 Tax=Ferruginibacter sp. SUN106 TaxID=2978348 RepID=UPI003D36E461